MMPLALAAVVLELKLITKLTTTPEIRRRKGVIIRSRN